VEGTSDRAALAALAARRGRDLDEEGVAIVPIGGAQNIGNVLERVAREAKTISGLCDEREEGHFRRAVERAGLGSAATRADLERLGFFVCVADLEDELVRALGPPRVEDVFAANGDLEAFRRFQQQPAQQGRALEAQLRRFMGTRSGGKAKYARLLVGALDLARVPRPLDGALAHARAVEA
jgi:hypothetical protein